MKHSVDVQLTVSVEASSPSEAVERATAEVNRLTLPTTSISVSVYARPELSPEPPSEMMDLNRRMVEAMEKLTGKKNDWED